jgi:hypothetical protein
MAQEELTGASSKVDSIDGNTYINKRIQKCKIKKESYQKEVEQMPMTTRN